MSHNAEFYRWFSVDGDSYEKCAGECGSDFECEPVIWIDNPPDTSYCMECNSDYVLIDNECQLDDLLKI